ncbi:hypothetical protein KDH_51790 [Dictyobacter sp. S3.2.2.5]|uniref:NnrS family protein n=1 Tax=Dictyobacter halimunensis TaxID=3026934 RepID=A0ABQ6FXB1_9CHLR|nr:hypothetical protein KDH_51790 [Dictyobacter sp. S3.2.2.5]
MEKHISEGSLTTRGKHSTRGSGYQQVSFAQIALVFRAALLLGAGGGFMLACVLTVTSMVGVQLGPWWPALAQAHGNLQVFGWAGLFVVGVSLYFLPRLRGAPLVAIWPVRWIVGALAVALCVRALAQPWLTVADQPIVRLSLVGSAILECLALCGVVLLLGLMFRRGPALEKRPAFGHTLPLIACSFVCLGLCGVINLVNLWQMTGGMVPATGDRLFVTLGLFGFLLPMTLGMSARSLPMYAGLDAFPPRRLVSLSFAYISGLLVFCAGILMNWQEAEGAGMVIIGGILILFVFLFLRTMRARGKLPHKVARLAPEPAKLAQAYRTRVSQERNTYGPFVALVASAYLWVLVSGIFLLINGVSDLLSFAAPLAEDALRHSLTIGFVSLLLCGLAPRMLPGFSGGTIRSARLVSVTLWLGNLAALLRVGSLLFSPWLTIGQLNLSPLAFGFSGILGLALALCLAINLWPALRPASASG